MRGMVFGSLRAAVLALLLVFPDMGLARDQFVTAGATQARADGSAGAPWPSVAAALDSGRVAGGDRLLLARGEYGLLTLSERSFDPPVTITSADGGRAHFDRIRLKGVSGLVFRDLDVWPRQPTNEQTAVVAAAGGTGGVVFERLDIRGSPEAENYYNWTQQDWLKRWRSSGVHLGGPGMILRDSTITGVSNGIGVSGARAQVIGNEVRGFSKDGLRGFGEGALFRGNTIRDCVKVDGNHDDGFQSWTEAGNAPDEIRGITLDGNRIIEWTGAPDHPLRCRLQGISMFRGPYYDMVIQNNLILVRTFHGIALYDAVNSRVVNNTVIQIEAGVTNRPRITERYTKGAGKSANAGGNIIANNLVTVIKARRKDTGNHVIRDPAKVFENPAALDFRLRADSPLLDTAVPAYAPPHDLTGAPRPVGRGPDPGAFERR